MTYIIIQSQGNYIKVVLTMIQKGFSLYLLQLDKDLYWWKWYQQKVIEENTYLLECMKTFFSPEASQSLCIYSLKIFFISEMAWNEFLSVLYMRLPRCQEQVHLINIQLLIAQTVRTLMK